MLRPTLLSFLFCVAVVSAYGDSPQSSGTVLFDFSSMEKVAGWIVVNDGVMGGRSKGGYALGADHLVFSGSIVTDGGGFSSIRGRLPKESKLAAADGIAIRLRTDGLRSFKIDLRQSSPARTRALSFRAPIKTEKSAEWQVVRVPFTAFEASWRGRSIPAAKLNPAAATQLGFHVSDGRDGPFRLEISSVSTYTDE